MSHDPIELLFGGMTKLGPGADDDTAHVLGLVQATAALPADAVVVDAGCGSGRQTIALARALDREVHAIDSHGPFLETLRGRAEACGVDHLIVTYEMNMKDVPDRFPRVDLLWAESSAYNLGFETALRTWARAVPGGGFVVASELTWLTDTPPAAATEFFGAAYPAMQTVDANIEAAERAGYACLTIHILPPAAWLDDYYDVLRPRSAALLDHEDRAVRDFAADTLREIEVFERAGESYGYVFYVLRRRSS